MISIIFVDQATCSYSSILDIGYRSWGGGGGGVAHAYYSTKKLEVTPKIIISMMAEKEGLIKQSPPATYQGAAVVFQPQVGHLVI